MVSNIKIIIIGFAMSIIGYTMLPQDVPVTVAANTTSIAPNMVAAKITEATQNTTLATPELPLEIITQQKPEYSFVTTPTITLSKNVYLVNEPINIKGEGFLAGSGVNVTYADTTEQWQTTVTGQLEGQLRLATKGDHMITINDATGGYATERVIVKDIESVSSPKEGMEETPKRTHQAIVDYFPPITSVLVNGTSQQGSKWFYDEAPIATFTAQDDVSGIKHIVLYYPRCDQGGLVRAQNSECILQNSSQVKLGSRNANEPGAIVFTYFSVDNSGKQEAQQWKQIWYDGAPPEIYVMKIWSSLNPGSAIPIASQCTSTGRGNCQLIDIKRNETVNFRLLGSDRVSGIYNMTYRIVSGATGGNWTAINTDKSFIDLPITLQLQGLFQLELQTYDIAGNASTIKRFFLRVT